MLLTRACRCYHAMPAALMHDANAKLICETSEKSQPLEPPLERLSHFLHSFGTNEALGQECPHGPNYGEREGGQHDAPCEYALTDADLVMEELQVEGKGKPGKVLAAWRNTLEGRR